MLEVIIFYSVVALFSVFCGFCTYLLTRSFERWEAKRSVSVSVSGLS